MRVMAELIKEEGIRVSPHSKFYILDDKLFEPVRYRNKLTGTYKPITDTYRIGRIMDRKSKAEDVPLISSVCDIECKKIISNKRYNNSQKRFELIDIRKD